MVFLITCIALASCCTAKKTAEGRDQNRDSSLVISNQANNNMPDANLPACILQLIMKFKEEEKQNPPRSIYRYTYYGKTVYFVPAVCCDFFSDLYDDHCTLLGHPDGGFTGQGDRKLPDFLQTRTNEKLIWKDDRK